MRFFQMKHGPCANGYCLYKTLLFSICLSLSTSLLHVVAASSSTFKSSSSSIPWHSETLSKKDWDNLERYLKFPPTVFAPQGRLHSVEQVMQIVSSPDDPSSNLVIALQCSDGVVVVSTVNAPVQASYLQTEMERLQTKNNDKTVDDQQSAIAKPLWLDHYCEEDDKSNNNNKDAQDSAPVFSASSRFVQTPFSNQQDEEIWAVTAGNAIHSQIFRRKIQAMAESMFESQDDGMATIAGKRGEDNKRYNPRSPSQKTFLKPPISSAALLARKLADNCQLSTQTIGSRAGRILISSALIVGKNDIWQVDATGQFWQCHAAVVGSNANKAQSYILEQIEGSFSNKSNTNAASTSTDRVQEYVNNLSVDEALTLACKTIRHTVQTRKLPFVAASSGSKSNDGYINHNDDASLLPRVIALSLHRQSQPNEGDRNSGISPSKVSRWYSQSTLLEYMFSGEDMEQVNAAATDSDDR